MDSFDSQPQKTYHFVPSYDYDPNPSEAYDYNIISPVVQSHLKKVYATLCFAVLVSALGAYLHIIWNIGGVITTLTTLFFINTISSVTLGEDADGAKVVLLMIAALFQGASIGPAIKLAININPSILVSAFVGTAIAFACFSVSAMLARRRQHLYLGGLLSSGVSILLWVYFASSIIGESLSFKIQLYFGLLVFVGYVVFDTQFIIEMAHLGDLDFAGHALRLYTDFIAVFIRILVIMLKNEDDREAERRRRRRRE
ncbi:bax inhibitor 1-like [Rutidosis leptorrhynchoides]|uniref:bax inhibitor 1-like n=1 Tax=Rutidosis leptorrhynchoides TaxID=125765 RepID=UPI003A9A1EF3